MKKNALDTLCFVLVTIGALNWGLVGLFKFNLVVAIFGSIPALVTAVYIIVGVAALLSIFNHCKCKGK